MLRRSLLSLAVAAVLGGCGLRLTPPAPLETKPVLLPEEAWSRVLAQRLDTEGRFDFEGAKQGSAELQSFLSYVATFSPDSDPERFPTAASRLVYWLNAYNAVAIYAVIDSAVRPEDRKRFYTRTKMMVGGSLRSLDDIEEEVSSMKDTRAYFALSGAAKGHPRLSPTAYTPGGLENELDIRTKTFMESPRNIQVDRARKVVKVSQVFEWHRDAFAERAVSVLAYINRFRDDKVPESYKVEYLPFDWSLNGQAAEPQAKKPAK